MKSMKKILSLVMALAIVLSMGIGALAVDEPVTYTITIDNAASGHTYEAYQIFTGTLSVDEATLSNVQWGSGVDSAALAAALVADAAFGTLVGADPTAAKVAKALSGEATNSDLAKAFATIVGANLSDIFVASVENISGGDTVNYTISGLNAGYYLVKDEDDSMTGEYDAYTRFILELVADTGVYPKSSTPTVDKDVKEDSTDAWGDLADYTIGDTVMFKLTGTMPTTLADYATYTYIFHDTLSVGLSYDANSVKVYLDDETDDRNLIDNSLYSVDNNGTALTISFSDVKSVSGVTATSKIIVVYTATLNTDALIYSDSNPNEVYLEYSNNPNGVGTGETVPNEVEVFTYRFEVDKYDGETPTDKLKGVEFKLYKTRSATETYIYSDEIKFTLNATTGAYRVDPNGLDTLTTDTDGMIYIEGLDEGTYYLEETKTNDGYNLLDDVIEVVIASAIDGDGAEITDAYPVTHTDVENFKGATLPSTGGIGTTIFYVIGSALVILAVVLLVAKNRKNKVYEEQ